MTRRRRQRIDYLTIPVPQDMRKALRELDPTMAENVRAYRMSECDVVVSRSQRSGWYMAIRHAKRSPTWGEIYTARRLFVASGVVLAIILAPEVYQAREPKIFHLWEVDRPPFAPVTGIHGDTIGIERQKGFRK